jgi:hypothetical protein
MSGRDALNRLRAIANGFHIALRCSCLFALKRKYFFLRAARTHAAPITSKAPGKRGAQLDQRYDRGDGNIYDFPLPTSISESRASSLASETSNIENFAPTKVLFLDRAERQRACDPSLSKPDPSETPYDRAVRRQREQAAMIKRHRIEPPAGLYEFTP